MLISGFSNTASAQPLPIGGLEPDPDPQPQPGPDPDFAPFGDKRFNSRLFIENLGNQGYLRWPTIEGKTIMLFRLRTSTSPGGRDTNDKYSNEFLFTSALPIADPKYTTLGINLAAALATILVNKVRITGVLISPFADNVADGTTKGNFMPVAVDAPGLRPLAGNVNPAVPEYVAIFNKSAGFGYSGRQQIRGCYGEDEVKSSPNLRPATVDDFDAAPFTAFAANIRGIFVAQNCQLVLPGIKDNDVLGPPRIVTTVKYAGPDFKQRRNTRTSLEAEKRAVAARELKEVERQREIAYRDNPGITLAEVVSLLLPFVGPLLLQYGLPLLLTLTRSAQLRALLRAAQLALPG